MCGTCDTADALAVVARARRVADALAAELLHEPVAKAMDLGTPRGFDRAVASLAAELRRQASRPERDAVREAVRVLDIDWRRTTPAQRRRLVSEAMNAAGRATALIPARIQATLGPAADEVISATRSHGRRVQGLAIGAEFNAVDRRIAAHVTRTQVNFVTDELGRRVEGFGAEARRIVAEGLEAGLGRDDLSAALQAAAAGAARALLRGARPDDSLSARLYLAEAPPRLVRSLLQVEGAGPVHAALLFADPPPSLRAFLAALPDPADPMALTAVDAALVACSADPLARLTRSGLRAPPPRPVG